MEAKHTLQPEAQWLAAHPGAATLKVKFNDEVLDIQVENLSLSVKVLKQLLSPKVGLAANKQKLQVDPIGFLKDNLSLAHYNLSEDSILSVGAKERGGRKK